nr:ferredoxin reductase family protein [uncultured Trichococcus sp.]
MNRKLMRMLIVAAYILLPVLIAAVSLRNRSFLSAGPPFLGIVSYSWLLTGVIIASRPRFIEHYFSLDKLNRFHAIMAVVALSIGVTHKLWVTALWGWAYRYSTIFGDLAIIFFLTIAVLSALIMTNWFGRKKIVKTAKTTVKKYPIANYEKMKVIHNFNILAAAFLAVHVLTMTVIVQGDYLAAAIFGGYFALAFGLYINHKFLKPVRLKKNLYTVTATTQEKGNVLEVHLKPEKGEAFAYQAGQFVFLRLYDAHYSSEEHPFSLISAPQDRDEVALAIKDSGDYTHRIQTLQPGIKASLEGPYGGMWHVQEGMHDNAVSMVMFAGGIGITPMLGILENSVRLQFPNRTVLVWSLKDRNEYGFTEKLQTFKEKLPDFRLVPFFANESGFLDEGKIDKILQENEIRFEAAEYLLCGPPPFMNAVEAVLLKKGVPKERIHYETFGL